MNQAYLSCLKAITDAQIAIAGMQAENKYRELCGLQIAYTEEAFVNVQKGLDMWWEHHISQVPR
jgi:hypothetical protein